jgi:hypothetical protein
MRRRSLKLVLGGVAVGVPTLTWILRRVRRRKDEKRRVAAETEMILRAKVEDLTPEQTAFLRRVREIWDALGTEAPADLHQTAGHA